MLAAARGLADYVTKEQIMEEGKIYPEASELRSVAATVSPPALVQTSPCIDPGILPEPFNPKPLSACHHEGRPSLMIRLGCGALKCVVCAQQSVVLLPGGHSSGGPGVQAGCGPHETPRRPEGLHRAPHVWDPAQSPLHGSQTWLTTCCTVSVILVWLP